MEKLTARNTLTGSEMNQASSPLTTGDRDANRGGSPVFGCRRVSRLLFNKILYLGEKNYLVHWDGTVEEVGADYAGKVRVAVIGKRRYFETQKKFPFSNTKEIRSAVKMDISAFSPFETGRFFVRKTGGAEENTTVNLWFTDKKLDKALHLLSPLLLIPETALLSFWGEDSPRIYTICQKDEETLLIYVGQGRAVRSMISMRNRVDLESFRRSVGAEARDCPVTEIAGTREYLALFPGILCGMSLKNLSGFVNLSSFSLGVSKRQLRVGTAAAAALFVLYTGLSVSLPYFVETGLKKEDARLSSNLSGLLKKQEMVDIYREKQKELAERPNRYTYKLPLINLLNKVLPEETAIRQLTVSGNMVEMRGSVPKASELLEALSQGEGVRNARLTSPLKTDKKSGMEVFTLTFVYEQEEKDSAIGQ